MRLKGGHQPTPAERDFAKPSRLKPSNLEPSKLKSSNLVPSKLNTRVRFLHPLQAFLAALGIQVARFRGCEFSNSDIKQRFAGDGWFR
jgi:hypothetical protein